MATGSPSPAVFAELSARTLHLAILKGAQVAALRSFSLDAKSEITAFAAEHAITGITRAAVLAANPFLHLSTQAEATATREPAALINHLATLPHGFATAPFSVAVDTSTGLLPDAKTAAAWLIAAAATDAIDEAKTKLSELGLTPASVTLAAPVEIGAVIGSLAAGETALVLLPGENRAQLAWVTASGLQSVAETPVGFTKFYEAVQIGLGLKFKAAAGKLFYNENYDFTEAAAKIAELVAPALQSSLKDAPATHLHISGLAACQTWFVDAVAAQLKLAPWAPAANTFSARLKLDTTAVALTPATAGVLQLASAGATDAPWVQATLATQAAKPAPAAQPAPTAPVASPPKAETKPATPFKSAPTVGPVAKTPAASPPAKSTPAAAPFPNAPAAAPNKNEPAPAPAPAPTATAAPKPEPTPVIVSVEPTPSPASKAPLVPRKIKSGPIMIAATVTVVAAIVGIAAYFKRPSNRPPPGREIVDTSPAVPQPVPVARPVPSVSTPDKLASDPRRFRNDHYSFQVSEKGYLDSLTGLNDAVLIESLGALQLQGSYTGKQGERKTFTVGGINDERYTATIKKSVKDEVTSFNVKVTHPRFELDQTFTCLPGSIKVTAAFTPRNLRDPRSPINGLYSIQLARSAVFSALPPSTTADHYTYMTKTGPLSTVLDSGIPWALNGTENRQKIIADDTQLAFQFTDTEDKARKLLRYEIVIP